MLRASPVISSAIKIIPSPAAHRLSSFIQYNIFLQKKTAPTAAKTTNSCFLVDHGTKLCHNIEQRNCGDGRLFRCERIVC